MKVTFEYRAAFRTKAKVTLEREMKASIEDFLHHFKETVVLNLVVFKAEPSNAFRSLIKVVPVRPEFGHSPVGVPVSIYTTGTQGVVCLLTIEGKTSAEVLAIIEGGPYKTKPQKEAAKTTQTEHESLLVNESIGQSFDAGNASEGKSHEVTEAIIHEELRMSGLPQHDITCLRVFYLELVDKHFGGNRDGIVFVSNKDISALMESAFRLKKTLGQFGAVYASRVRPFAESIVNGNVRGWNFSAKKVLVFIGGSLIPKMAMDHPHTMNVPPLDQAKGSAHPDLHEAERATPKSLDEKPVVLIATTGAAIEQMVHAQAISGFDLIAEVATLMKNRAVALTEVSRLSEVQDSLTSEAEDLERLLVIKREQIRLASIEVQNAQENVKRFEVSEHVWVKVREARDQLDQLLSQVGQTSKV